MNVSFSEFQKAASIVKAGWDRNLQIREEVSFTAGKVIVRGKLVSRGK